MGVLGGATNALSQAAGVPTIADALGNAFNQNNTPPPCHPRWKQPLLLVEEAPQVEVLQTAQRAAMRVTIRATTQVIEEPMLVAAR